MDAPHLLEQEWARKDMIRKIDQYYDDVWVYGPRDFWNPLDGLQHSENLTARMAYTGYLRRRVPTQGGVVQPLKPRPLLVTAGGGGDGAQLMRQVLAAHEFDPSLTRPISMVLGPFMSADDAREIRLRARAHPSITLIDFNNRMEAMIQTAAGIVAMGGYNTFCEILSLDKRALIVPRTHPREEQLIRARRASELGLIDMLLPDEADEPAVMAAALHKLDERPKPSEVAYKPELDGLTSIGDFVEALLAERKRAPLRRSASGSPG
jgi:predicted glycosyltransferase